MSYYCICNITSKAIIVPKSYSPFSLFLFTILKKVARLRMLPSTNNNYLLSTIWSTPSTNYICDTEPCVHLMRQPLAAEQLPPQLCRAALKILFLTLVIANLESGLRNQRYARGRRSCACSVSSSACTQICSRQSADD